MQKEELRKQIATASTKTKVLKLTAISKRKDFSIEDLIDLTFDADQQIGFRASWILENIMMANYLVVLENLENLLYRLPQVSNQSCQRHYAKILMRLTSPKIISAIKIKMEAADLEPVVETCFNWLINPNVPVAVKVFCGEVLFNLRNRYDWIADELTREIEFLMKDGSAAMQSKGKKILKQLQQ